MNHSKLNFRASLFLIAASACWGIATVITKYILNSVPPITLLTIQLSSSVFLLWFVSLFRTKLIANNPELIKVGWLGLLNPGISYTLSLVGLRSTTASMSIMLWASEPIWILFLAWWILREKLSNRLIIVSLIAISGVVLMSGVITGDWTKGHLQGNVLILAGVLCCALYTVLVSRVGQGVDTLLVVSFQQTLALFWAFILLPFEWKSEWINLSVLEGSTWFWAGISGVIYYALAFWFYLKGLAQVQASLAGFFINLIPIFGIGGAFVFLGERLTPLQWIGAGVLLLSIFALWFWRNRTGSLHDL